MIAINDEKQIDRLFTQIRWVAVVFSFILFISINVESENKFVSRLMWFIIYNIVQIAYSVVGKRKITRDSIAVGCILLDIYMISVLMASSKIISFPIEICIILLIPLIILRFRASFISLCLILVSYFSFMVTQFLLLAKTFRVNDIWEVRLIFWSFMMFLLAKIMWDIVKNYDELGNEKEINRIFAKGMEHHLLRLYQVNEASKALNDYLVKEQIIKVFLENFFLITQIRHCALMMYEEDRDYGTFYYYDFSTKGSRGLNIKRNVYVAEEIYKIKNLKEYKHAIHDLQPFTTAQLHDVYHIESLIVDKRNKFCYMQKLIFNTKDSGYLLFSTDEKIDSELTQIISLLIQQAGTAIGNSILYEETYKEANTDPLTQVKTRRYLKEYLEKEIKISQQRKNSFIVLFFDIDNFKNFNDTYGHKVGDEVLKIIAEVSSKSVRETDLVSRYGGEEFVIVLSETNFEIGCLAAERIRKNIENTSLSKTLGIDEKLTVSMGIAIYPTDAKNAEELIAKADWAMYKAKKSGKNQLRAFKDLEEEFYRSLDRKKF